VSSRFAWGAGILFIVAAAVVTIRTLPDDAPGARGIPAGESLAPFAAPLATSRRRCDGRPCDANVARRADSGARGARPACEVRGRDILNSCELAERGPVALAFLTARAKRCEEQIDVLNRLRPRFPGIEVAAVAVRGDLGALRATIRRRGWRLPVGYDHDGAVSSAYGVVVCPSITFARRGGEVQGTSFELLGEEELARRLQALGG
jgi:hypothetical protein